MKKVLLVLLSAVLVMLMFNGCEKSPSNGIDETSIVWKVEPELEYNNIYYCSNCNLLKDADISDIKTIIETLYHSDDGAIYICGGHGGITREFFIDEAKELYIIYESSDGGVQVYYYTLDEFKNWTNYPYYASSLNAFRRIDSEKIIEHEYDNVVYEYDLSGAYLDEKYALVQETKFITDFIYDDYKSRGRYRSSNFIDFKLNDKWGIVDKNGNTLIQFIFDDIEFINDRYAFAKYNGKYGVLDMENIK